LFCNDMIALPFDHQVPRAKSLQRADSHLFSPDCDQAIADATGDYPVRPMTAIQFRQERGAGSGMRGARTMPFGIGDRRSRGRERRNQHETPLASSAI
jgi:hypothetical protein